VSAGAVTLERFVRGEVDPTHFPHREHVRMAFEMLRRHDFAESVLHYSRALRAMVTRAGKPEAFHQTITVAFLALVAERMAECGEHADFATLVGRHPELLDKSLLRRWYAPQRLGSVAARHSFILPEPSG
jgi:hypothetical protein